MHTQDSKRRFHNMAVSQPRRPIRHPTRRPTPRPTPSPTPCTETTCPTSPPVPRPSPPRPSPPPPPSPHLGRGLAQLLLEAGDDLALVLQLVVLPRAAGREHHALGTALQELREHEGSHACCRHRALVRELRHERDVGLLDVALDRVGLEVVVRLVRLDEVVLLPKPAQQPGGVGTLPA
jgi:hypothetical protein